MQQETVCQSALQSMKQDTVCRSMQQNTVCRSEAGYSLPKRAAGNSMPKRTPKHEAGYSMPKHTAGYSMPKHAAGYSMPKHAAGYSMPKHAAEYSMPKRMPKHEAGCSMPKRGLPIAERSLIWRLNLVLFACQTSPTDCHLPNPLLPPPIHCFSLSPVAGPCWPQSLWDSVLWFFNCGFFFRKLPLLIPVNRPEKDFDLYSWIIRIHKPLPGVFTASGS